MMFVKEKLAQFDNVSISGFDRRELVSSGQPASACTEEWSMRMRALQTVPVPNIHTGGSGTGTQEEQKIMNPLHQPGVPVSAIKAAKNSIRKLAMFETYSNSDHQNYDFEWPNASVLKTITSVKQLRLKEIRYQ